MNKNEYNKLEALLIDTVNKKGENDGVCKQIFLSDITLVDEGKLYDALYIGVMIEDGNLFLYLQNADGREGYTDDEYFDSVSSLSDDMLYKLIKQICDNENE